MKSYSEWVKESNPGNYVSYDVTGLPLHLVSTLPGQINSEPHITVMYSKESAVPLSTIQYVLNRRNLTGTTVPVIDAKIFSSPRVDEEAANLGCIVLTVKSTALNDLHNHLLRVGCKHSFSDYESHATLIYDIPLAQAELALVDIKKAIQGQEIFLTLTTPKNTVVNTNWVAELNNG